MTETKIEIKDKKSKKLTVYEKFLRLPKVLTLQKCGVPIEYTKRATYSGSPIRVWTKKAR